MPASAPARGDLPIYHLDGGMGDSTLAVDTDSERTLLIDAGNRGKSRRVVAPAIRALGFDSIYYVVATHHDATHIGGFDEVVAEGIAFEVVLDRGNFTDRSQMTAAGNRTQYGEYLDAAGQARRMVAPSCEMDIHLGIETTIRVVAAGGRYLQTNCDVARREIDEDEDDDFTIAVVTRHAVLTSRFAF